jgi:hypothetical protein
MFNISYNSVLFVNLNRMMAIIRSLTYKGLPDMYMHIHSILILFKQFYFSLSLSLSIYIYILGFPPNIIIFLSVLNQNGIIFQILFFV